MTHQEQEQQVLTFLLRYQGAFYIKFLAQAVGLADDTPLRKFLDQKRGLSRPVLAKLWAWMQQLHRDTEIFT